MLCGYNKKIKIPPSDGILKDKSFSDKEFFESIGEKETKRYFETAYKFVFKYKNLGEQYILYA